MTVKLPFKSDTKAKLPAILKGQPNGKVPVELLVPCGLGKFLMLENPRKEVGEMEDVSARVAVKWSPTDRLSFLVTADGNEGDGGLRPYDTLIDEVPTGALFLAEYRNSDTAANPYNNNTAQESQTDVTNEAKGVALTVEYQVADNMGGRFVILFRHVAPRVFGDRGVILPEERVGRF